jgi:hypothetical protein
MAQPPRVRSGRTHCAPTRQASRSHLRQAQLTPDTAEFLPLPLPVAQHQRIARGRVTLCAVGFEFDLAAGIAAPAGQVFDCIRHSGVFDRKCLTFETGQVGCS